MAKNDTKLQKVLVFPNGAIWPVQSSNPRQLFRQYLSKLKNNKHPNKELQELYNTQGEPILQDPT